MSGTDLSATITLFAILSQQTENNHLPSLPTHTTTPKAQHLPKQGARRAENDSP